MDYIDNPAEAPCPACRSRGNTQLIEHEDEQFCEECWPDRAAKDDLCRGCGADAMVWRGRMYHLCEACAADEAEDAA
jgi:hypothetical protein